MIYRLWDTESKTERNIGLLGIPGEIIGYESEFQIFPSFSVITRIMKIFRVKADSFVLREELIISVSRRDTGMNH